MASPSRKSSSLSDTLALVHAPEAKALIIYNEAKQHIKKPGIKLPSDIFADSLEPVADHAINHAFNEKSFSIGFALAERYGKLESLVETIITTPLKDPHAHTFQPRQLKIPGYKSDREWERKNEGWLKNVKGQLVDEVLLPSAKYSQAVSQLFEIDKKEEAFGVARKHFDASSFASLAQKYAQDFEHALHLAQQESNSALVLQLQDAHVSAVIRGRNTSHNRDFRYIGRRENVDALARFYHFPPEKIISTRNHLFEQLISEWTKSMWENDEKVSDGERKLRHGGGLENRFTIYDCFRHVSASLSHTEEEIVSLINSLPDGEKENHKETLYHRAGHYRTASFDAISVAIALKDWKHAMNYACSIHHQVGGVYNVSEFVQRHILPHAGIDEKKQFIQSIRWEQEPQVSIEVAKSAGIGEWLMDEYARREKYRFAAQTAVALDKTKEAKEYFTAAHMFLDAMKYTPDPAEKAALHFMKAGHELSERVGYKSTFRKDTLLNDQLKELKDIQEGINLGSKNPSPAIYTDAALSLAARFFKAKEYSKGALFLEEARVPQDQLRFFLKTEHLTEAETAQDFAGCYHIARLQGDDARAANYRGLAVTLKQPLYQKLGKIKHVLAREYKKADLYRDTSEPGF